MRGGERGDGEDELFGGSWPEKELDLEGEKGS
jgi:hypothetical protein